MFVVLLGVFAGEGQGADAATADCCTDVFYAIAGVVLVMVLLMNNTLLRPIHNLQELIFPNTPVQVFC